MALNFKTQKSSQLLQAGVAVPIIHLSKMEEFGIKDLSVYIIIELKDKLLIITFWEQTIFDIPSCLHGSNPRGPEEP